MVSVSGIRGIVGDGFDPHCIVKYTSAFADFIRDGKIVVGRDARNSGEMVNDIVTGTLLAKGLDVITLGICPTPTVQFAVKELKANGGIAISASHNPNEWNALKLLNSTGQYMTPDENKKMLHMLSDELNGFKAWDKVGKITHYTQGIQNHIDAVLNMKHVDLESIRRRKFKVLADCVNGAGVYVIPELLREFGCEVIELNCEKTGVFTRLPEPIPENLTETMRVAKDAQKMLMLTLELLLIRMLIVWCLLQIKVNLLVKKIQLHKW
jgi:phosphomannomutase